MKEIICWIFGHQPVSVNVGTQESPEQGYVCEYCGKDLSHIQNWKEDGLWLNSRVTKFLLNIKNRQLSDGEDLPF